VKHRATTSFWQHYEALPLGVRLLADKNFALLKRNPRHPSVHFKKVGDELWSARIGGYRALALEGADAFHWIWIGTHDEYARRIS
jgi:hypothetical protein